MFDEHFETDLKDMKDVKKIPDYPLIDLGADPDLGSENTNQGTIITEESRNENPFSLKYKRTLTNPLAPGELGRVIALYDFQAREPGDLSFAKGDIITVIEKSDSSSDWWTGQVKGHQGLFPANFVEEA